MPPVEEVYQENLKLRDRVAQLEAALAHSNTLEERLALMQAQLEWFKKQLFGAGKSETLDAAQMQLGLEALTKLAERPNQQVTYERRAPQPAVKQAPPSTLPTCRWSRP